MHEGECVATGRKKRSEVDAPSLGPLSVVLNERLGEGQISATEYPCALTSSRAFIPSHCRWGTNILTRNYCRFTERGRSLSSPQQRGGSDTPLLCAVVTWKQMSIRFCMLSSVAWGYCQLLISPRFGVTCVGFAGVAFEPMSCTERWHAVPSPDFCLLKFILPIPWSQCAYKQSQSMHLRQSSSRARLGGRPLLRHPCCWGEEGPRRRSEKAIYLLNVNWALSLTAFGTGLEGSVGWVSYSLILQREPSPRIGNRGRDSMLLMEK